MNPSIKSYQTVCKILGIKPVKITEKFKEVPEATLVIVPDQAFNDVQLIKLARKFGEDQPYETYVYDKLYPQYSAEELSGTPTGKNYRVLYTPKKYNVDSAPAKAQAKKHAKDHVPTVLEAIVHWFVLREAGESLNFNSTYIRHFDLEPKAVGGWSRVPLSYVDSDGEPFLRNSVADSVVGARLAVGSTSTLDTPLPSSAVPLSSALQENTEALNQLNDTLKGIFHV